LPRKKKSEKPRWTDPVVLVPIITAVIASIVGPTYYYYFLTPKPPEEPEEKGTIDTRTSPAKGNKSVPTAGNSLSVRTDKNSYGFGDYVKISGSVEKPAPGKTVRLDVYDPNRDVFAPFDRSVPDYVPQTDIQVKPNNKGEFSYRFPTEIPIYTQKVNGTYVIEGTYDNVTRNTTFTIR
jgi:hypothetical protein